MIEINLFCATLTLLFCFVILPLLILTVFYKKQKLLKCLAIFLFVIYVFAIAILVFYKIEFVQSSIKVYFTTNGKWLSLDFQVACFSKRQIMLNLIMMFPVSAFILAITKKEKFCYKKSFLLTVVVSFLMSFIIEFFQFVLPVARTTELFDLLINTISGVFGFLFFWPCACFVEHVQQWLQNSKRL